jgi:hypothetical protein
MVPYDELGRADPPDARPGTNGTGRGRPAGSETDGVARGINTTFRVDAAEGGRYVLRVQRPDSPSVPMARSKMTWLAALRRNTGLVVPRAVRTRSGNGLTVIEDPAAVPTPRSCVLYRSVEGRFLDSTLTERHLHKVGPFTARLQSHGTAMAGLAGFERGPVNTVTELGRTPPAGPRPPRRNMPPNWSPRSTP